MSSIQKLNALVLTTDAKLIEDIDAIYRELAIHAHHVCDPQQIADQLDTQKYEAVVIDLDNVPDSHRCLGALRQCERNRNTTSVAIATNTLNMEMALYARVHFVLRRPIETKELRRTLRAAYDFMLSDRRYHARYPVSLPLRLRLVRSGSLLECSTMNVSTSGIAAYTPMSLRPTEPVDLELVLPDSSVILAAGIVVWDDGHGKSGLTFKCREPEMRHKLDAWLQTQLRAIRPGIREEILLGAAR